MRRQDVEKWVRGQASGLESRLAGTLGELTASALEHRRLGVTMLALGLRGRTSVKHRIKRVDRFLGNPRVEQEVLFEALGRVFWQGRGRVLLALDWTVLPGDFHAVVLSVILEGRSVPVAWNVVKGWRLHRSRNALEQGLLLLVESYWPPQVERVVLADRGFGYAELARFLEQHGWFYILRVNPKVRLKPRCGEPCLYEQLPVGRRVRSRRQVQYRSRDRAVRLDLVWTHQADQNEPWYLVTNLVGTITPTRVVRWYGYRMRIEEGFRDGKSERWGFGLKETRLRQAQRWSRLLLVLALALTVLHLLGRWARSLGLDAGLTSTSKRRLGRHATLSTMTIGLRLFRDAAVSIFVLLQELRQSELWG
jgi:hypothetical protein